MGHGLGTVVLTSIGLTLRSALDIDTFSGHAELVVGGALVFTGLWSVYRALYSQPHSHSHSDGVAMGLGTLHGFAGGAHVVVVITAMALPFWGALSWLMAFILGATGAMGGVGWLLHRGGGQLSEAGRVRAQLGAGAVAVVVGVLWAGSQVAG